MEKPRIVPPGDQPTTLIKASDAARLVGRHDLKACVIIAVRQDGTIDIATNGDTDFHKGVIAEWGQRSLSHSLSVVPFQTAFGHGNGGVPKALTPEERSTLGIDLAEYIERNTHLEAI